MLLAFTLMPFINLYRQGLATRVAEHRRQQDAWVMQSAHVLICGSPCTTPFLRDVQAHTGVKNILQATLFYEDHEHHHGHG